MYVNGSIVLFCEKILLKQTALFTFDDSVIMVNKAVYSNPDVLRVNKGVFLNQDIISKKVVCYKKLCSRGKTNLILTSISLFLI